jgi:hypothetical protein
MVLLSPMGAIGDATAQSLRYEHGPIVELPPTEGRGCYYFRGREYCGSYCYWEINGKRYCHSRLSEAHSQAGPDDYYVAEPRPYGYRGRYGILK